MRIPPEAEATFITCTFGMLGLIAAADGSVSRIEAQFIEQFIKRNLEFDKKRTALALEIFKSAKDSPLEMQDYARKFTKELGDRIPLRDKVVEVLLAISIVDGMLSDEEDELIRSAALLLDLSEPAYHGLKRKFVRPEQQIQ